VALDVIEEPLERSEARPAQEPAMHADRQHLRAFGTFGVEHVEGISQIREELLAAVEALGRCEAHVVGVQRVGNDEVRMRAAVRGRDVGPERQIVAVVVGVVQKAAMLDDETARVRAVATGVPAERRIAAQRRENCRRFGDVRAFGGLTRW
jgi:hypothetical protein